MLLHAGPALEAEHLDLPDTRPPAGNESPSAAGSEDQTLKAAKARAVNQFEQSYLAEVLRRCEGNVSRAAKAAGKERRSFQRLLRKHSVDPSGMPSRTTA
jgi:DNA-binding NtrC family response regulator